MGKISTDLGVSLAKVDVNIKVSRKILNIGLKLKCVTLTYILLTSAGPLCIDKSVLFWVLFMGLARTKFYLNLIRRKTSDFSLILSSIVVGFETLHCL